MGQTHPVAALGLASGLLVAGCSAKGLTGDRICTEGATTVASRVYACTADRAQANDAAEALLDLGCQLGEGDTAGEQVIDGHLSCIEALDRMTCDQVELGLADPTAWLAVDPSCAGVYGEAQDTGATP